MNENILCKLFTFIPSPTHKCNRVIYVYVFICKVLFLLDDDDYLRFRVYYKLFHNLTGYSSFIMELLELCWVNIGYPCADVNRDDI